jgi:hypothetical protein
MSSEVSITRARSLLVTAVRGSARPVATIRDPISLLLAKFDRMA